MKILLTGATGFLGRNLLTAILADGHEVIALCRATTVRSHAGPAAASVSWHNVERGFESLFYKHPNIDCIIHTAATYGRRGESIPDIVATNMMMPFNLLDASIKAGVSRFINTDSSLPRSINTYTLAKAQFADWGRYCSGLGQIQFFNIRLEHMYGPDDDETKFTSHVINACRDNRPELELTLGEQLRDFIYIDDVVAAYRYLISDMTLAGFEEIELGSGHAVAIREFVELVRTQTNSSTKLNFGAVPYRHNEVMLSVADTIKLASLGWQCKTDLNTGIRKVLEAEK